MKDRSNQDKIEAYYAEYSCLDINTQLTHTKLLMKGKCIH